MKFQASRSGLAHGGIPWIPLFIMLTVSHALASETIHHELHVKLLAEQSRIEVIDYIKFPAGTESVVFSLRSTLAVKADGVELTLLEENPASRLHHYRLEKLPADGSVRLGYEGSIKSAATGGPFAMPESVFGPDGVYLDGASHWIPRFENYPRYTFRLQVDAPENWEIVSQGKRRGHAGRFTFSMPRPQEDIYLLGAAFTRYSTNHDGIELDVYLYDADAELAQAYLQASAEYLGMYSKWIGPYPYARFAVVENRWQTGYGMPSFTLLGSRVMRLPFILTTSLPHEILHNWWGNGVYIDFSKGNWSEGLTAYMSDHLGSEQQGKGGEYRRKALERYANFAASERDFALADFKSRHDEASQAVGYSKSMMLFHMLRRQTGDEQFNLNVRKLWQDFRFRPANFVDVLRQLHAGNHGGLDTFVEQWLYRTGAPEIALTDVALGKLADGYLLSVNIEQTQPGPGYTLQLPLEVELENSDKAVRELVTLSGKHALISLKYRQRPRSIVLDPDYDVFRLLHPGERPASLGRLFGAKKQLLVLPANAPEEQVRAWRQLATAWSGRYKNVELVDDNALQTLPDDTAAWLLGWQNSLLDENGTRFSSTTQHISGRTALIGSEKFTAGEHAVVLLDPDNSRTPLGFIGADTAEVIALLAAKLPHYGGYGVLAFNKPGMTNILKQHLPVRDSPMARQLDIQGP